MQRVKDPERFLRDLERPLPLAPGEAKKVTRSDLEQDGESFVAFAAAMGMKKPSRLGSAAAQTSDVTSAPPAS